jgi:plastocyanin
LAFIDAYPALFGGNRTILSAATVIRNASDTHHGMRSIVWEQTIAGIAVHRGLLSAHLTKRGDLISIGSHFVPTQTVAALHATTTATIEHASRDGRAALVAALRACGDVAADTGTIVSGPLDQNAQQHLTHPSAKGSATAHFVWFPLGAGNLRLAWDIVLTSQVDGKMYETVVDAADNTIHERQCLTIEDHIPDLPLHTRSDHPTTCATITPPTPIGQTTANTINTAPAHTISLRVFTGASPTPMSPGWPTSDTTQPPTVNRTLETLVNLDADASPNGWMDETLGDTRGNNVDAHTDLNNDDLPDTPRPLSTGSPPTFDFPCDLTQAPSTYRDAAITNLFYWNNVCHDRLYSLGFTEAFGNFQNDNFGRGGVANDAVQADAQDGGGTNNANFSTPADGLPGRMQMYLFTFPTPYRDGDFDAHVIIHEYCHGLSNRLVGGGVGGMYTLQAGGMGEGWSDFMSLCLLTKTDDTVTGTYPVGGYLTYGMVSDNYYRGIRRYPYVFEDGPVTNASKNPLTFNDIRWYPEVHAMGEVWCQTLWEARANLILKLGNVTAGNDLIMRLVVDGMKLTPASPTFLQARDAILQADLVLTNGANQTELWQAFAKRGMGFSAVTASSTSTEDVVEAFDIPGDLRVLSVTGIVGNGPPGGPFTPATTTYTLSNSATGHELTWTATANQPWLTISPAAGILQPGENIPVTITFNEQALQLVHGTYHAIVSFTNTSDDSGSTIRSVDLMVATNYHVSTVPMTWIDPSFHTNLFIALDTVSPPQSMPFPFTFYDQSYSTLYVSPSGLIAFGSSAGLPKYINVSIPSTNLPNACIYAAWDDLNPSAGGSVRIGTEGSAPNRQLVISWVDVPHWSYPSTHYTMQIILSENTSDIIVNYLNVSSNQTTGAGASATVGVENQDGSLARQFSCNTPSLSNQMALRYYLVNQAPTIAAPATALLNPVHGTCATILNVLGADDSTESELTYTWSVVGGASAGVTFSANGTNAAKSSTATFNAAGSYDLRCTITDAEGLSVTSDITVVMQAPTIATTATADPTIVTGRGGHTLLQVLGAISGGSEDGLTYSWSVLNRSPSGVTFATNDSNAAKTTQAIFSELGQFDLRVTIQDGTGLAISSEVSVTVLPIAPLVATAAYSDLNPVHGTATTTLTVLGDDDGGEANLLYSWSVLGDAPGSVVFSHNDTNDAKTCSATFSAAGDYNLRCTITDADGLSVISDLTVRMLAPTIAEHASANPVSVNGRSGSAVLRVLGAIESGDESELLYSWQVIGTPPAPVVWGANGINGSKIVGVIFSALGRYDFQVTITDGTGLTVSDQVTVWVTNATPTVITPAAATPGTVSGVTTTLAVLGSDDSGEENLIYTWTSDHADEVSFSTNSSNEAKATVATFSKAGTHHLTCTMTDQEGQSTTSSVTVTVDQTATAITISPATAQVTTGATFAFSLAALDQFGAAMPAPSCAWTVSNITSGTIDSSGLFTATTAAGGPYTVTATYGTLNSTASITVTNPPEAENDSNSGTCGLGSGLAAALSLMLSLLLARLRRR